MNGENKDILLIARCSQRLKQALDKVQEANDYLKEVKEDIKDEGVDVPSLIYGIKRAEKRKVDSAKVLNEDDYYKTVFDEDLLEVDLQELEESLEEV